MMCRHRPSRPAVRGGLRRLLSWNSRVPPSPPPGNHAGARAGPHIAAMREYGDRSASAFGHQGAPIGDNPAARGDVPAAWEAERGALVVAHPGHELRIHHWLERARPVTLVLTDGSGHGERGRINSTTTVLDRVGARRGVIYGPLSDRQLYRAILAGEHDLFTRLADETAA